jgi:hypothetical protein
MPDKAICFCSTARRVASCCSTPRRKDINELNCSTASLLPLGGTVFSPKDRRIFWICPTFPRLRLAFWHPGLGGVATVLIPWQDFWLLSWRALRFACEKKHAPI